MRVRNTAGLIFVWACILFAVTSANTHAAVRFSKFSTGCSKGDETTLKFSLEGGMGGEPVRIEWEQPPGVCVETINLILDAGGNLDAERTVKTGATEGAEDTLRLFDGNDSQVDACNGIWFVGLDEYKRQAVDLRERLETFKLTAGDASPNDSFGKSIAIAGESMIVGSPMDDDGGTDSGAAYVYRFDGCTWAYEIKIKPDDPKVRNNFGRAVAIRSDVIFVGAPREDTKVGIDAGAFYIFRFDGVDWIQEDRMTPADPQPEQIFGRALALSSDAATAVVGAPGDSDGGTHAGAAYVYRLEVDQWVQTTKLVASDAEEADTFGRAVSISEDGTTVVVGSSGDDSSAGAAYVFRFDGANWTEDAKLDAGQDKEAGDIFGRSVAVSGDTILIGARRDDDGGIDSGSAYVFRLQGSVWSLEAKLTASDAEEGDGFGRSVALSGNKAIIGALEDQVGMVRSGSAYFFQRFAAGKSWDETVKFTGSDSDGGDEFASAVGVSGRTLVTGARGDDDVGTDAGSAYVFDVAPRSCLQGAVNSGNCPIEVTLLLNGSEGIGEGKTVTVQEGDTITASILLPSAGGSGRFVVHANPGEVTADTATVLPARIGTFCFPLLIQPFGEATPAAVWNNLGKPGKLGQSEYFDGNPISDPAPAPTVFLALPDGDPTNLPMGTTITFQGVMVDPGASSGTNRSVTNAVVLQVL